MSTPTDPAAERSFTLHDLRVEVVAPEGARIYCGQPGDHFELRGEMLHLPPGQGFSISVSYTHLTLPTILLV